MTAREELARLLFMTDNSNAADPAHEWEMLSRHSSGHLEYVYHLADGLIAAGYERRPAPEPVLTLACRITDEHDACAGHIYLGNIFDKPAPCDCPCHTPIEKIEPAATPQDRTAAP